LAAVDGLALFRGWLNVPDSEGVIKNYLLPEFGQVPARAYSDDVAEVHESRDKIRDVLSGILQTAVTYGLLVRNPMENVFLPPEKRGRRRTKPYITPQQFASLIEDIPGWKSYLIGNPNIVSGL
jgi:hypothetical protein